MLLSFNNLKCVSPCNSADFFFQGWMVITIGSTLLGSVLAQSIYDVTGMAQEVRKGELYYYILPLITTFL